MRTPTPSRKDGKLTGPKYDDTLSRSSTPSASSIVSVMTDEGGLPFADSNSGQGSVREVHVCRVSLPSTASSEMNSGNVTPTALDFVSSNHEHVDSEVGFTESVVEEVSKRLQVNLEPSAMKNGSTDSSSLKIPFPKTPEAPKSPNLTSISLASKTASVKVGQKGHSTALTGITLSTQSSNSQPVMKQQEGTKSSNVPRGHSARSPSPEREPVPGCASPVELHKAIWVETHLGEEEDVGREGERADSPPVLAIVVKVIPEDESVSRGTADRPSTPSESLRSGGSVPESSVSLTPTTGKFNTTSQRPEEPGPGSDPKLSPPLEKHRPKEARVTRKTVNLPSKHKVFARKVYVSPEPSLDEGEPTGEQHGHDSASKTSETTEAKP